MLFVDVDALCKLAHWNLLPILPELIGHSFNDMATVSSLSHRARRAIDKPDGKLFHCVEAARSAHEHITQMGQLAAPNSAILTLLADSPQIDSGEALLLALTATDDDSYFLTGDKRALRALSKLSCSKLFAGKIIIIEHILFRCLHVKGRRWLLDNVCPHKHIDTAISIILGSRCDGEEAAITSGIKSYLTEIIDLHDPSLLYEIDAYPSFDQAG